MGDEAKGKIAEAGKSESEVTPQEKIVAEAIADRPKKETAFGPEKVKDAETSKEEKESESSEAESESATDEKTDESEETEETDEEESEESEETEESDSSEEESEEAEVKSTEEKDVAAHVKTSMQKRIDKITAEKKTLEEKLEKAESEKTKTDSKKEPVFTRDDLRSATKKFMDEGDSDGLFEVMEYMTKQESKALEKKYRDEQDRIQENVKAKNREWTSVVNHYSNDEDPTLDIRKTGSLLFKVAKQFFEDPELGPSYLLPGGGGMQQAVADALAEIRRYRADKGKKDKSPLIKAKTAKAKRKKSLAGTGSMRQEGNIKKSSGGELEEYLKDRKSSLAANKGLGTGD